MRAFAERSAYDPEFTTWLADHRAGDGGKVRVGKGGTGVRVVFSEATGMAWQRKPDKTANEAK